MLQHVLLLLLFCLVAVHGRRSLRRGKIPPVPYTPVGPFDREDTNYSPSRDIRGMFEGDIKKSGRGIVANAGSLNPWPNAVIPYRFDCSVENIPSAIKATKDAMKVWEQKTCIRFVEKRPQDKAFLEIFRAAGCWATFVGYRKDTKTQISIGSGCDYKHVMEHELGHVIGFWHEQSRKDRDDYISIVLSNVVPALRYNFNIVKSATSNYGHAYDYGSIMHYPWNAFAINRNRPTIIAKKALNGKVPYVRLSDVDAAQTNNMYKCKTVQRVRGVATRQIKSLSFALSLVGRSLSVGFKCVDERTSCGDWAKHGYCSLHANPLLISCSKSCGNCGPCEDKNTNCGDWKKRGYCTTRPDIMYRDCKVSCRICLPEPCVDKRVACTRWAKQGHCTRTPGYMSKNCRKACQFCKSATKMTVVLEPCVDKRVACARWAKQGHCTRTPGYMSKNCRKACQFCKSATKTTVAPTRPTKAPCKDKSSRCKAFVKFQYCKKYPKFMNKNCEKTCGLCGKTPATTKAPRPQPKATTQKPAPKLTAVTIPTKKFTGIRCEDRSSNCKAWEKTGRCDKDRWVMDNCLLSCKRFTICDPAPIKPIGSCASALGVGWNDATNAKILNPRNFVASSVFSPGGGWVARPRGGRLYLQDNHARREVGAWCAHPGSRTPQYLEIDLGARRTITAVATQGRDRYFEHVKSYSLSFSDYKGQAYRKYKENGQEKIFDGNCDHFTPVMNLLKEKPVARFIRFHPTRFIGAMCLRVEVYGC